MSSAETQKTRSEVLIEVLQKERETRRWERIHLLLVSPHATEEDRAILYGDKYASLKEKIGALSQSELLAVISADDQEMLARLLDEGWQPYLIEAWPPHRKPVRFSGKLLLAATSAETILGMFSLATAGV